jgi:hypothetical protein
MSLIKANAVQVGQSPTATQNFTLAVPSAQDGTIKLARGNAGATTQDVLSVDASGNVSFNGKNYLGGFSVDPLLNNQGLPLQSGNLYWNTVSNNLWAHNGTSWAVTNFNEFTNFMLPSATPVGATNLVNGLQYEIAVVGTTNWNAIGASSATIGVRFTKNAVAATGDGTARRTRDLVERFVDVANVRDWGAYGDGNVDDTNAIQNAINLSSGSVFFPAGRYRVTAPIFVRRDNATLFGTGGRLSDIRIDHNGNGIVFEPTNAGINNVFLNNCGIRDISVSRPGTITTPADNIWIRQCNGFTASGVQSLNGSTCFRFTGGQLNSLLQCRAFIGNATITPAAGSAFVVFEESILSVGGTQPCYTTTIDDFIGSCFPIILRDGIRVASIDGLNLSNAYMSGVSRALMTFERTSTNDAIAAVNISNCYFDCTPYLGVNTPSVIFVNHAIPGTEYGAGTLNISNCVIANNDAFNTTEPLIKISRYVSHFNMSNCYVANGGSPWGVEINDAIAGTSTGRYKFTGNTFSNLSQAVGGGAVYAKDVGMIAITGNTFNNTTTSAYQVLVDGTVGTVSAIGNITDGTATQIITIPSGATITRNRLLLNAGQTSTNIVQLSLPISSAGLPSGSMWNDGGIVKII